MPNVGVFNKHSLRPTYMPRTVLDAAEAIQDRQERSWRRDTPTDMRLRKWSVFKGRKDTAVDSINISKKEGLEVT